MSFYKSATTNFVTYVTRTESNIFSKNRDWTCVRVARDTRYSWVGQYSFGYDILQYRYKRILVHLAWNSYRLTWAFNANGLLACTWYEWMQTRVSTLTEQMSGQSKETCICQELIFQVDTMRTREYKEHVFLSSMHCIVLCFVSFDHLFY